MKRIKNKLIFISILLFCSLNLEAQNEINNKVLNRKRVNNIIPRLGIGMSRHFITEFGIAFMQSNFINHKDLGLNTNNIIGYFSFETMTPFKKPLVKGYKIGIYFNPDMRKEIGRHRINLTYCFNRKSDRALSSMLSELKNH